MSLIIPGPGFRLKIFAKKPRGHHMPAVRFPFLAARGLREGLPMCRLHRDAVWDGLDICPRTCPSLNARLCTYAQWFARPLGRHARSLLDLPVSRRCLQRFLRLRMGCHRLPRDTGAWVGTPGLQRICNMCRATGYWRREAFGV